MEFMDYKYMVLEVLWDRDQSQRLMCELRMTLFIKAAITSNTSNPHCLMPFPACFYDSKTKIKDFKNLHENIHLIPKLDDIKESTQLPNLTWELLYWIFTNPLTIQPIKIDVYNSVQELRSITNLQDIPIPDNQITYLFKILPSHPKSKFINAKQEFGTSYAFHGSPLHNFHSIIHRGLVSSLNKRSAHGIGTYLSSKLLISQQYGDITEGWSKSVLGNSIRCIAIVEIVNHPSVRKIDFSNQVSYHVVDNDDYMQLSYLLLSARRVYRYTQ